jgi:hypothetical protein
MPGKYPTRWRGYLPAKYPESLTGQADGKIYGGSRKMERQDTDGVLDLPLTAAAARVEKSRRRSGGSSGSGRAKEGISRADKQQSDFAVELSLLQSVYEQALQAGLQAMSMVGSSGQTPVLSIHLWNVSKCPECGSWIGGLKCPIC